MRKICHIADSLSVGGLERTIVQIVSGLPDFQHCVCCLSRKGAFAAGLEARGVEVREFAFRGGVTPKDLLTLTSFLKQSRPDIVHAHGFFPSMWGRMAGALAGIPLRIVHVQNVYYSVRGVQLWKYRMMIPLATRYIAVSGAVRDCCTGYVGIPANKVRVVYNASADLSAGADKRREMRRRLGLADTDVLVGGLGRLEEHKGFGLILEAVAACRGAGLPVKAVIVGDGPFRPALEAAAARDGLSGHVIMPGMRMDIGDYLAAMDIFVQPSTLREGLPLSLAEAASAGLPLIASDIGGNREIAREGANGYVIAAGDAAALTERISRLAARPGEREAMGRESRRIWGEQFTVERMTRDLRQVYDE